MAPGFPMRVVVTRFDGAAIFASAKWLTEPYNISEWTGFENSLDFSEPLMGLSGICCV